MARNSGTRQDTWVVRVHLTPPGGAVTALGIWDKKTGGELDSDEVKYYPGGMAQPESLGGRRTTGNLTLQRIYDRYDDHPKINMLFNSVGKGTITVAQRPMDINHNEIGKAIQWHGILKRVLVPDVDSEATSAALVEIEVSVSGYPVAQ
jgi:hypothetical protein